MGFSDFLLGLPNAPRPSLNGTINGLQDASALFVSAYKRNDASQADRATNIAVRAFDFIVGEIMRDRDRQKANGIYENSAFKTEMNAVIGRMIAPVTRSEHIAVRAAGPGNGQLPSNLGTVVNISIERTLNKIKHRHPDYANFRIQNERHIFIICPDKPNGGGPDSVVEFDVEDFCNQCRMVTKSL